jgi:HSP20 family protein
MSGLREALRELPDAVFADLLESDDAYLLVLDLAGVTAANVDLSTSSGRLTVEARRAKDLPAEFRYVREDRPLFLDAEVPLPSDATGEEASAQVRRGVVEVELPKRETTDGHSIPVEDA